MSGGSRVLRYSCSCWVEPGGPAKTGPVGCWSGVDAGSCRPKTPHRHRRHNTHPTHPQPPREQHLTTARTPRAERLHPVEACHNLVNQILALVERKERSTRGIQLEREQMALVVPKDITQQIQFSGE